MLQKNSGYGKRKVPLYLIICMMAIFLTLSCNSQNNMDRSVRTRFAWEPTVAAPRNYPIEMKYAFVGFGEKGKYPIIDKKVGNGIATPGSEVGLTDFDQEGYDMPNRINAVWLSYAEKKYYKAEIKLSEEVQARILELFREGFRGHWPQKWTTYGYFVVSLLPKGRIWLFLASIDRTVLVCDNLQANEIQMSLEDFEADAYEAYHTTDKLCEEALKYHEDAATLLKKNGIPDGLWQRYGERFNYKIDVVPEDKDAKVDPEAIYYYVNGETQYSNDSVPICPASRLQKLECAWFVVDTMYTGHFFFDEDEVMSVYPKAFGTDGKKNGKLLVKISKYNNWFDISLRVGEDEYPLQKTKIHVFKITPENKEKHEDHLFYWNYSGENEEVVPYIGE